jgi:hypothetical protein
MVVKAIGKPDLAQAAVSVRLIVEHTRAETPRDNTLKDRLDLTATLMEAISSR